MSQELMYILIGNGVLAIIFGSWAYNDCNARQVSMDKGRPWRPSDPLANGATFFLLTMLMSWVGLLAAYIQYNGLRTYSQTGAKVNPVATSADDLLKWKQLLDSGAITQPEFDAKKAQIMNTGSSPVAASKKMVW